MTDREPPTPRSPQPDASNASDPLEALRQLLLEIDATTPSGSDNSDPPPPPRKRRRDSSSLSNLPLQSDSYPVKASGGEAPRPPRPSETPNQKSTPSEVSPLRKTHPKKSATPPAERNLPVLASAVDGDRVDRIDRQVQELETRLEEATSSMGPLMPIVKEILASLSPVELRNEVINALVPAIDRVIRERVKQNPHAMYKAISEIIPGAIAEEIANRPQSIANALGPEIAAAIRRQIELDRDAIRDALASEMGRFIKAQIELERDAMVDALYPVIGNTIAKYMAEAVREINSKVENALSFEGVRRKIRARLQGVSEAELILQEALPFRVKAAFLIHKGSGLVICSAQISLDEEQLDADTIAGMLTAIRSFAADCMVPAGQVSELSQIEYDTFDIMMEVAGYCYLAVVSEGVPPKPFIEQLRHTLGYIVQKYGDPIEQYDGDPDTVPPAVGNRVQMLVEAGNAIRSEESNRHPPFLLIFLGLLLLGLGAWGIRALWVGRWIAKAETALQSTPELAVYRLEPRVKHNTLILSGEVPTPSLRDRAEAVVSEVLPERGIDNRIVAVNVPPDTESIEAEVDRTVATVNSLPNINVRAHYTDDRVSVFGEISDVATARRVSRAFEQIPGVANVVNTARISESPTQGRLYFGLGSAVLSEESRQAKLVPLAEFLLEFSQLKLTAVGHTDTTGTPEANQKLALKRAEAVKAALVELGVSPERIEVRGSPEPPPDVDMGQTPQLSRCVRFEVSTPETENR
ncbi:OmpA family protein [Baaleninema sp.]|uniref:OmpA family protein n=1 Tax=Baaleninema sp. TaxID=3101197 RepID=UPI003CFD0A5B